MKTMGLGVTAVSFIIMIQGCGSSQPKGQAAAAPPPQGYSSAQHEKTAVDDMDRTRTARGGKDKNLEILMQKVKADKKLLVASNMDLTESEAKKFWPIYDSYQKDLERINQQLGGTIIEYADAYNNGSVPNDKAEKLLTQALDAEEAEVKLKQSYTDKLEAALSERKVARYIQIENKIRAAVKGALAERIPLVY